MDEVIIREGWLEKQGGMIKTWKKRWFEMKKTTIYYFKQKNGEMMGQINVTPDCKVQTYPGCKKQPSFLISVPSQRNFVIVAPSKDEHDQWIEAIQYVINGKGQAYLDKLKSGSTPESVVIPPEERVIRRPGVKPGSRRPPARSIQPI